MGEICTNLCVCKIVVNQASIKCMSGDSFALSPSPLGTETH